MKSTNQADPLVRMTLQLPASLRDLIRDHGASASRSMSAEAAHRLRQSFNLGDTPSALRTRTSRKK